MSLTATEIHYAFRGLAMSLLTRNIGAPASSSNASQHASSAQGSKEAYSSSTLARCGVSSSSLSRRSLRVFPSLDLCFSTSIHLLLGQIMSIYFCDGCLKRRTVDSCGNSTCLKTPQSGFLEEAEAVPAESNGPKRKTT